MSILDTESFIAFQPVNSSDDTFTGANTTARNAVAANLRRRGYAVTIGAQGAAATATGFAIRPDPVNPERNALFYSSGGGTNSTVSAALRVTLPIVGGEAVVGGFSLYIPNEYVKSVAASSVPTLRVVATAVADTAWNDISSAANHTDRELFRIRRDLQIGWSTETPPSQKTLGTGRTYFIEYRVSPTDIRVWIDDVLVLQKVRGLCVETIGFVYEHWSSVSGAETVLSGAAGRWAIGNWYNLVEDANAPNVRLGPSTRIIGVRPGSDVQAQFIRPGGYASNAAVAALDLVDSPVASLQSSTVGDQDVYDAATDTTTSSGTQIHAVVTKVLASNLESNAHTIRPLVRSSAGLESSAPKARALKQLTAIANVQLNAIARRPTDGKLFAVGNSIACYSNANNGAGAWTAISNDGGAINYKTIAFRSDGWGVIGRSDGKFVTIAPGSDTPGAPITVSANTNEVWSSIALPNGRIVLGCASGIILNGPTTAVGTPDNVANWTRLTATGMTGGAITGMAYAPASSGLGSGSGRLVIINDAATTQTNRSDDSGATWGASASSATASTARAIAWDGSAFTITAQVNNFIATYMRRSTDGIAWSSPPTPITSASSGVGQGATWYGAADPDVPGLTFSMGSGGTMMVSINSVEWRSLPRLQTSSIIRGAVKAANGDWLFVGDAGLLYALTAGSIDGAMPALAGYQTFSNIAAANPSTGTAWTPAEAAASQFGMRLTS